MKRLIISLIPGACLTVASIFLYVQPPECVVGVKCSAGVQRGGFPLAVVKDQALSSPTSGWGRMSLDDFYNASLLAFLINSLCYTALWWVVWEVSILKHK